MSIFESVFHLTRSGQRKTMGNKINRDLMMRPIGNLNKINIEDFVVVDHCHCYSNGEGIVQTSHFLYNYVVARQRRSISVLSCRLWNSTIHSCSRWATLASNKKKRKKRKYPGWCTSLYSFSLSFSHLEPLGKLKLVAGVEQCHHHQTEQQCRTVLSTRYLSVMRSLIQILWRKEWHDRTT